MTAAQEHWTANKMNVSLRPIILAAVAASAVACAPSHNARTAEPAATTAAAHSHATAQQAAAMITAAVKEVTSVIVINEDNDANSMIGRTGGYAAATVLVDSRITEGCETDKPGIDCGAGVEEWPDEAAAQKRANYIKTVLSSAPMLGTEYQTVKGNLLLRVSGKLNHLPLKRTEQLSPAHNQIHDRGQTIDPHRISVLAVVRRL